MRPPESWSRARVTLTIAAAASLIWFVLWRLGISDVAAVWGGFIPARVGGLDADFALAPLALTPVTAAFLHAGLAHLLLNMLVFLFCGRAVENIVGGLGLAILFLAGAYAATAAEYALDPSSLDPMIGSSGAVSAVIGTYAMLFGRNRVRAANPRVALWLNALWLAAAWIALQLMVGVIINSGGNIRIAIGAHVGGFLAGLVLAKPLLLLRYRKA